MVADGLDDLHEDNEHHHREKHQREIQSFITVSQSEISHSARADGSCHGGSPEKPYGPRGQERIKDPFASGSRKCQTISA